MQQKSMKTIHLQPYYIKMLSLKIYKCSRIVSVGHTVNYAQELKFYGPKATYVMYKVCHFLHHHILYIKLFKTYVITFLKD